MWLVFDQLAPHDSISEMKGSLVSSIRTLVTYMRERQTSSRSQYLKRVRMFRDFINEGFGRVRASAEAVLFEFGPNREQALKLRNAVRAWQPQIRTLFLLQVTLAHIRLREQTGSLPEDVERMQEACAKILDKIADALDQQLDGGEALPELTQAPIAEHSVAGSLANDSLVIAQDLLKQVQSAGSV